MVRCSVGDENVCTFVMVWVSGFFFLRMLGYQWSCVMLWRDIFPIKMRCIGGSIVSLLSAAERAVRKFFNKKIVNESSTAY